MQLKGRQRKHTHRHRKCVSKWARRSQAVSKSEKEETGSGAKTNKDRLGPVGGSAVKSCSSKGHEFNSQ